MRTSLEVQGRCRVHRFRTERGRKPTVVRRNTRKKGYILKASVGLVRAGGIFLAVGGCILVVATSAVAAIGAMAMLVGLYVLYNAKTVLKAWSK